MSSLTILSNLNVLVIIRFSSVTVWLIFTRSVSVTDLFCLNHEIDGTGKPKAVHVMVTSSRRDFHVEEGGTVMFAGTGDVNNTTYHHHQWIQLRLYVTT